MNYELAKQLKDAGFPMMFVTPIEREMEIHFPTLEELIEACGKSFHLLRRNLDGTFDAVSTSPDTRYGMTPTEAVARLWLAINTKV